MDTSCPDFCFSGSLKNVTVSQKCGKWYVSIQTEFETKTPTPNDGEIGIDMGIVSAKGDADYNFLCKGFSGLKPENLSRKKNNVS